MVRWKCKCGKDDRKGGRVSVNGNFECYDCIMKNKLEL